MRVRHLPMTYIFAIQNAEYATMRRVSNVRSARARNERGRKVDLCGDHKILGNFVRSGKGDISSACSSAGFCIWTQSSGKTP